MSDTELNDHESSFSVRGDEFGAAAEPAMH